MKVVPVKPDEKYDKRWSLAIKELFSALLIREYGEITLQPLAIALIKRVLHFLFNLKLYKCRAL